MNKLPLSSIEPEIRQIIKKYLKKFPNLVLEDGGKHIKLRNTLTNDWVAICGSCSDSHSRSNQEALIKRLAVYGRGYVAFKTGKVVTH